jgi:hypothetical protein
MNHGTTPTGHEVPTHTTWGAAAQATLHCLTA